MRAYFRFLLVLLMAVSHAGNAQRALPFRGSFLMSFSEGNASQKKAWPFHCTTDVTKTAIEIKDEMNTKGVNKRIIYNLLDSSWLMLLSYNNVKQATRINATAMFSDKMIVPKVKILLTGETKMIDGNSTKKYIIESETDSAVAWIAAGMNFDIGNLYKMLAHCGMMNSYVDDGTWYYAKKIRGMVLEVTSYSKTNGTSYSMFVTGIQPNEIIVPYFDLAGYKITDIPPGENCGQVAIEPGIKK
ncbi:hypothetical protein BH11BAC1_BH11BAC1_18790 [soil metagenome]